MDGIKGIAAITGIIGFGLLALSNFLSGGDKSFTISAQGHFRQSHIFHRYLTDFGLEPFSVKVYFNL